MRSAAASSIAVGFFDGVHLGHRKILEGADAALTFRNHPLSLLRPEDAPLLMMSADDRLHAIRACGVENVNMIDFTREVAEMDAEQFAERHFRNTRVLCGENWRFGRGGKGDAALLRRLGIDVTVVPYAEYHGEKISSSRIRECLLRGEIEDANAMLGHRFSVAGRRVRGKGIGKGMGFPTVNIDPARPLGLRLGVYVVEVDGVRGIANYGHAPTMEAMAWSSPVLEVHFPKAVPELSDAEVCADFVRFLRDERKFATIEELKLQIADDCGRIDS